MLLVIYYGFLNCFFFTPHFLMETHFSNTELKNHLVLHAFHAFDVAVMQEVKQKLQTEACGYPF